MRAGDGQDHPINDAAEKSPSPCPDPNDMAAYVDKRLAKKGRDAVENHFAWCGDCRRALIEISRLVAPPAAGRVDPGLMQRLKDIVGD